MRRGSIRFEGLRFDIFYIEDTFACMSVYSIIRCRAIDSAQNCSVGVINHGDYAWEFAYI
jgi:hypothetical protein